MKSRKIKLCFWRLAKRFASSARLSQKHSIDFLFDFSAKGQKNMEIDFILKILDLIIKLSAVAGILFVSYSYCRVSDIERQIDNIRKPFDNDIKDIISRTMSIDTRHNAIKTQEQNRSVALSHLRIKRKRILSKIPFLK